MNKSIKELKKYVYPNGKYSNIRANSLNIKRNFPDIYDSIKNNYHTNLYMLCNDIKEIPECKNPNCNNKVKLENIGAGFRTYCSRKCLSEHQKVDKEFANKISQTHSEKRSKILKKKYPDLEIYSFDKNYFTIQNYCKHSPFNISRNKFHILYKNNKNLCEKCKEEIVNNYIPTEEETREFQNKFNEFYKDHSLAIKKTWFITHYPKEYKIILEWSKHIEDCSLSERIFLFKNRLKNRPICVNPKCNRERSFNHSSLEYTKTCNSYSCKRNISAGEMEVLDFIKSLGIEATSDFRIGKKSYDIKVDNYLFEYNGLYWHGEDIQKESNYHINKCNIAVENGYQLINIWEDDWIDKQDIVKSIIRNKLNRNENKIFARKCDIREVSSKDNMNFCIKNHLQGSISASVRYGLYFNDELVSLMTFGKKRKVLGQNSSEGEYELLRFCNKLNTSVVGGASRLYKHFIKNYNPRVIISYANCDISDGGLYEKLGFKKKGHTGLNYWWVRDRKKYHRSNFMKHKLVERGADPNKTEDEIMKEEGYYRLYGTGNLKYEYVQES
jgi:hypothetical protein